MMSKDLGKEKFFDQLTTMLAAMDIELVRDKQVAQISYDGYIDDVGLLIRYNPTFEFREATRKFFDEIKEIDWIDIHSEDGHDHNLGLVMGRVFERKQFKPVSDMVSVDVHGFSQNYIYEYVRGGIHKTPAYEKWCNEFPYEYVRLMNDLFFDHVDWGRPVALYMVFDSVAKLDVPNLHKSFVDRYMDSIGQDDNVISVVHVRRGRTVKSYSDGKIYFMVENVRDDE